MMRPVFSTSDLRLLASLSGVFLLNQLYVRNFRTPVFFSSYLDDLLCMPLVLLFSRLLLQLLPEPMRVHRLPPSFILTAFLIFALYFEWLLPLRHPGFTADLLDLAAYGAGCFFFARREWHRKDYPEMQYP